MSRTRLPEGCNGALNGAIWEAKAGNYSYEGSAMTPAQFKFEALAEAGRKQWLENKRELLLLLRKLATGERIDADLIWEIDEIIGTFRPIREETEVKISKPFRMGRKNKRVSFSDEVQVKLFSTINSPDQTPPERLELDTSSTLFKDTEITKVAAGPTTNTVAESQRIALDTTSVTQIKDTQKSCTLPRILNDTFSETQKSWIGSGILNKTSNETQQSWIESDILNSAFSRTPSIRRIWEPTNESTQRKDSELNFDLKRKRTAEEEWAQTRYCAGKRDSFSAVQVGSFRF